MKIKITLLAATVILTTIIYSCRKDLDIADTPQIADVITNITAAEAELSFNNNKSKGSGDAIFSANKSPF